MEKIYFDNNIYDKFVESKIEVLKVKEMLKKKDLKLVISISNIFEWASCWKSGNTNAIKSGTKVCKFVKQLFPCYFLRSIPDLIKLEINKAFNNVDVNCFYHGEGQRKCECEIETYAQGVQNSITKEYVEHRWKDKKKYIDEKINDIVKNRHCYPDAKNMTFSQFYEKAQDLQVLIARGLILQSYKDIKNKYLKRISRKILNKRKRFPVFETAIRANLFLNYHVLRFDACSHDRVDDYTHLINASYSDIFLTSDGNLFKYAKEIRTNLQIWKLDDFFKGE